MPERSTPVSLDGQAKILHGIARWGLDHTGWKLDTSWFPNDHAANGDRVPEPGLGMSTFAERSFCMFSRYSVVAWFLLVLAVANPLYAQGTSAAKPIVLRYDFHKGPQGWIPGFAEYSLDSLESYQLKANIARLPKEVHAKNRGYRIQGMNRSDDLFMYLSRQIGREVGLVPNQKYELKYDVKFASDAPSGGFGIGGSPGESVFLKVGAFPWRPKAYLGSGAYARYFLFNVDKGNQSNSGYYMSVAGDVTNGRDADLPNQFVSIHRSHTHTELISTTNKSRLWLLVGTDSGYEGFTRLYYQEIRVTLTPK